MKRVNYNYSIRSSGVSNQKLNTSQQLGEFLNKLGILDKKGGIAEPIRSIKIDLNTMNHPNGSLAEFNGKTTISVIDLLTKAANKEGHFFSIISGTNWNERLEPEELTYFLSMFLDWICLYQQSCNNSSEKLMVNLSVLSNSLHTLSDRVLKQNVLSMVRSKVTKLIVTTDYPIGKLPALYQDNFYQINPEPDIKLAFSLMPEQLSTDLASVKESRESLKNTGNEMVRILRSLKSVKGNKPKMLTSLIHQFKVKLNEIPGIKISWDVIINGDIKVLWVPPLGTSELLTKKIAEVMEEIDPFLKHIQGLKKKLDYAIKKGSFDKYKEEIIRAVSNIYVSESKQDKIANLDSVKFFPPIKRLASNYNNFRHLFIEIGIDISNIEALDSLIFEGLGKGKSMAYSSDLKQLLSSSRISFDKIKSEVDSFPDIQSKVDALHKLDKLAGILNAEYKKFSQEVASSFVEEFQQLLNDIKIYSKNQAKQLSSNLTQNAVNLEQELTLCIKNIFKENSVISLRQLLQKDSLYWERVETNQQNRFGLFSLISNSFKAKSFGKEDVFSIVKREINKQINRISTISNGRNMDTKMADRIVIIKAGLQLLDTI